MNAAARSFVQKYLCEVSWGARLFAARVSARLRGGRADAFMQASPAFRAREEVLARQKILRSMLPSFPYWILGHARLGLTELELQRFSDEPLPPRARATVRMSIEAIERLSHALGIPAGRALLEAEFLRASLDFLDRKFAPASERLNRLLEPERAVQMHERVYRMAVEKANACADVLG